MTPDLPEGWILAVLPDVADINMGQSPPGSTYNDMGDGLPFFQGKADFGPRFPTVRVWCSEPKKLAHPGDILISVRAPVGPTNVVEQTCVIGRGLAALTPLDDIPTEFILFVLRMLEPELALSGTGSTFTAINRSNLDQIEIALPPLAEQRLIVAKVEELLARVEAGRERLDGVPKIMKRFRQAILAAACSGRLTEGWRAEHPGVEAAGSGTPGANTGHESDLPDIPETWLWSSIDAVCSEVVDCPHSTPEWSNAGEICIRTTNFRAGVLDLSEVRYVSPATYAQRISRLEPKTGDVVYSREGGILGIACMIPPNARLCLGQRMMLMRTDPEKYVSTLLMNVLNSPWILARVKELTGGTSSPHLNVADIKSFPVPLPPLEEQREVVHRVEALFKLADVIEKRVVAARLRADKLTQSILAKAFRGELVPTEAELARREGRSYEPASVFLERIITEREKGKKQSQSGRHGRTSGQ